MSCDPFLNRIADAVMQDAPLDSETRAHLDTCDTCRNESNDLAHLWNDLGALPPPPISQPRIAETIRLGRVMLHASPLPSQVRQRSMLIVVGIVVAGFVGYGLSSLTSQGDAWPSDGQFLFLLHDSLEPTPTDPAAQIIEEYNQWAHMLAQDKRLVGAEKLAEDSGHWLTPNGLSAAPPSPIGGYFIIHARSYEEAIRLAETSPHLRYGGTIEIRAIASPIP